jgi:hypothetical protein
VLHPPLLYPTKSTNRPHFVLSGICPSLCLSSRILFPASSFPSQSGDRPSLVHGFKLTETGPLEKTPYLLDKEPDFNPPVIQTVFQNARARSTEQRQKRSRTEKDFAHIRRPPCTTRNVRQNEPGCVVVRARAVAPPPRRISDKAEPNEMNRAILLVVRGAVAKTNQAVKHQHIASTPAVEP